MENSYLSLSDATTSYVLEVYSVERIKTQLLLKRNLKALIKLRGKTQGGLARALRLRGEGKNDRDADTWISHILSENPEDIKRELPMELWDRAAHYLGVDTFHFLIPGIADSESTERRSGQDRRKRPERRLGTALPATEGQLDLMNLIRNLPESYVEEAMAEVMKVLDRALQRRRARRGSAGDQGNTSEIDAPTRAQGRKKR